MTEEEAWLWLASLWDAPCWQGHFAWISMNGFPAYGLCYSIAYSDKLTEEQKKAMRARLFANKPLGLRLKNWILHQDYWWPMNSAGARERAAYCRKMARACK